MSIGRKLFRIELITEDECCCVGYSLKRRTFFFKISSFTKLKCGYVYREVIVNKYLIVVKKHSDAGRSKIVNIVGMSSLKEQKAARALALRQRLMGVQASAPTPSASSTAAPIRQDYTRVDNFQGEGRPV